jgi:hypothetical protein
MLPSVLLLIQSLRNNPEVAGQLSFRFGTRPFRAPDAVPAGHHRFRAPSGLMHRFHPASAANESTDLPATRYFASVVCEVGRSGRRLAAASSRIRRMRVAPTERTNHQRAELPAFPCSLNSRETATDAASTMYFPAMEAVSLVESDNYTNIVRQRYITPNRRA